jgi:glucose/arabinose dehydrogenase
MRLFVICCSAMAILLTGLFSTSAVAAAVGLERVASGLDRPVYVTHAPGDQERLFIVEKTGTIKILNLTTGTINATPFLTVPDTDDSGNEEGLLGLAFHPEYADNGKFYINVTVDDDGGTAATRTHVRQYIVSGNPDVADTMPTEMLVFNQPQENHNGGWMGFGPNDGYLYIMTGDGGGGDDNDAGHTAGTGNAQDITSNLLGKVLRIDVDGTNGSTGNYGNPSDNPFVGETGDDEIWAHGLRNPWRASFDRMTGDFWIGDVGQSNREEVDFQPASSDGGENYGWRLREGTIATPTGGVGGPAPPGAIEPIYDYGRGNDDFQGGAVVGGYVYRGPDPELQGIYFFADTVSGNIWTMIPGDPPNVENVEADLPPDVGTLDAKVSFGEDAAGNLYIVNLGSSSFQPPLGTGSVYRIATDAVMLQGDYNSDGFVDAADYVVWRKTNGTSEGYETWRANFGTTLGSGLGANANDNVPEPTTLVMLTLAAAGPFLRRHRATW